MLKKTIKYTDFNGMPREEDFYFNLSKAELVEMQLGTTGGFEEYIRKIVAANDIPSIAKIFKDIVLKAYGIKSDDGRRFIKSAEISDDFTQTEAYNQIYIELIGDPKKFADFVNGIMPRDLIEKEGNITALPSTTESIDPMQ